MNTIKLHILLADDDTDDCEFFEDAIDELPEPVEFALVTNGVELMGYLNDSNHTPDLIFLDLNMPKKSGLECITEIKSIARLSQASIIIYSTSLDQSVVNNLYEMGADHYIQKPAKFSNITNVIKKAIALHSNSSITPRSKDNFIIEY